MRLRPGDLGDPGVDGAGASRAGAVAGAGERRPGSGDGLRLDAAEELVDGGVVGRERNVHPARGRFVVLGDDGSFDVVGPLGAFGRQVPVFSALEVGPLLLDLAEAVLVFLRVELPLRTNGRKGEVRREEKRREEERVCVSTAYTACTADCFCACAKGSMSSPACAQPRG